MTPTRSLLLATLLFAAALPAIADPAGTEGDRRLREKGWTIDTLRVVGAERPGVRHLTVRGRLEAPAKAVWQAIAYSNETGWPGVDQGTLEYENGDTTIARYKISVPVYRDRRYRLRVVNDDSRMFEEFHQVAGYGNVRAIDGSWTVQSVSDSVTLVDYDLDTDPGVRLVPGFIITWATKRMVPDIYAKIYKDARSDAAKLESRHD